jgi:hypothetical protein
MKYVPLGRKGGGISEDLMCWPCDGVTTVDTDLCRTRRVARHHGVWNHESRRAW